MKFASTLIEILLLKIYLVYDNATILMPQRLKNFSVVEKDLELKFVIEFQTFLPFWDLELNRTKRTKQEGNHGPSRNCT